MSEAHAPLTLMLAEHVVSFHQHEMQPDLVHQIKRALMDYFCAAITGSQTEVSKMVYRYLLATEGEGDCHAIGYAKGLSKPNAAFLNGTSAHCLDFDDGHTQGSIHPGAVVIPAVLAVAQHLKVSPEKMMAAIAIGYDICLRISAAMHPASRNRGFHNTPVAGIFGATAATAFLHGATVNQTQQAFGVAGSFSSGIFAFLGSGSEVKRLHPGKAARDGIIAAEMTLAGMTGPANVLESESGFFQAFAGGDFSADRLLRGLGSRFEIMDIYFKPYPCCRHLHSAIDAIQEVKDQYRVNADHVSKLRIGVNRTAALHAHKKCSNLLDAQMSLPYAAAAAFVHDHLSVDVFQPQSAPDQLWRLCHEIEIYVDEAADRDYPAKRAARVELELRDGTRLTHFVDNPLGEPSKPISDEQLEAKFLHNCAPVIGEQKARQYVWAIKNLPADASLLLGQDGL